MLAPPSQRVLVRCATAAGVPRSAAGPWPDGGRSGWSGRMPTRRLRPRSARWPRWPRPPPGHRPGGVGGGRGHRGRHEVSTKIGAVVAMVTPSRSSSTTVPATRRCATTLTCPGAPCQGHHFPWSGTPGRTSLSGGLQWATPRTSPMRGSRSRTPGPAPRSALWGRCHSSGRSRCTGFPARSVTSRCPDGLTRTSTAPGPVAVNVAVRTGPATQFTPGAQLQVPGTLS